MYDRWFTDVRIWASLGKAGIRKSRTTLGDLRMQTKDQLTSTTGSWAKLGLQKSHTTLGEILGLHNCAVPDKGSIDE